MKIYKTEIKLWLDDLRPMPPEFDMWAKNVDEAKAILNQGDVEFISFDNDLAEEQEGRHLASWIEEKAFNGNIPPMDWQVHSANPIGAKAISQAMQNAERFWNENLQTSLKS